MAEAAAKGRSHARTQLYTFPPLSLSLSLPSRSQTPRAIKRR